MLGDVPSEVLVLAAAAVALWAWQRGLSGRLGPAGWIGTVLAAGVLAGLASLAKLSGLVVPIIVAGWVLLALALPGFGRRRQAVVVGWSLAFVAVTLATFVALNPTLTARPPGPLPPDLESVARLGPVERFLGMLDHRAKTSVAQQKAYGHYALTTLPAKVKTVVVQGFGRYGPFGPREFNPPVLYDWTQDRGAVLWVPWMVLGECWAVLRGRRQLRAGRRRRPGPCSCTPRSS